MKKHFDYKIQTYEAAKIYNYNHRRDGGKKECPLDLNDKKSLELFHGQIDCNLDTIFMEDNQLFSSHNKDKTQNNVVIHEKDRYTSAFIGVDFNINHKTFNSVQIGSGTAYIKDGYVLDGPDVKLKKLEKEHIIVKNNELLAIVIPYSKSPYIGKGFYSGLEQSEINLWKKIKSNEVELPDKKKVKLNELFKIKTNKAEDIKYFSPVDNESFDTIFGTNDKAFCSVAIGCGTAYIKTGYDLDGPDVKREILEKKHIIVKNDELLAIVVPYPKGPLIGTSYYTGLKRSKSDSESESGLDLWEKIKSNKVMISKGEKGEEVQLCDIIEVASNQTGRIKYFSFKQDTSFFEVRTHDLRKKLYKGGFKAGGKHYVRYARSAGSAREGKVLFIEESLLDKMNAWRNSGIDAKAAKKDQLVGWEAYSALTLSSLMKNPNDDDNPYLIKIPKASILVIPDAKAPKNTERCIGISAEAVDGKSLRNLVVSDKIDSAQTNDIWDGECLLDKSVFDEAGLGDKGMMLLRNSFFKSCGFNTNLQKWFSDNGITKPSQLSEFAYPRPKRLKDIKMIVCPSSIKYLKFFKSKDGDLLNKEAIDKWLDVIVGRRFGVVKCEKKTHFFEGKVVRTSYQLINTLDFFNNGTDDVKGLQQKDKTAKKQYKTGAATAEALLKYSKDYFDLIQNEPAVLRQYLGILSYNYNDYSHSANTTNTEGYDGTDSGLDTDYKNKTVFDMLKANANFAKTALYREFMDQLRESYKKQLRDGHILVSGTNATLFGNPYEFLEATLQKNKGNRWETANNRLVFSSPSPESLGRDEIHSNHFSDAKDLVCARSPHVTMGNLFRARNKVCDKLNTYFNLSNEIACVNSIDNALMDRLNGADFDSDTFLVTDDPIIVRSSNPLEVPLNLASNEDVADLDISEVDINIADNRIGEIINLSQSLNSIWWTLQASVDIDLPGHPKLKSDILYQDIVKLAILSNMEIDKAKRDYRINVNYEIRKIRRNIIDVYHKHYRLPYWLTKVLEKDEPKEDKEKKDICVCPMSLIHETISKSFVSNNPSGGRPGKDNTIKLSELCGINTVPLSSNDDLFSKIAKYSSQAQTKLSSLQIRAENRSQPDDDYEKAVAEKKKVVLKEFYNNIKDLICRQGVFEYLITIFEKSSSYKFDTDTDRALHSCRWLILAALAKENGSTESELLKKMRTTGTGVPDLVMTYDRNVTGDYNIFGYPFIKV